MSESALPESLARFRTELEDAIRRDLEVGATARSNGRVARVLRAVRKRPGRMVVAFAAVAGAAAAALFVSSPWQSSPRLGSLEEVQAALTPPSGRILHMKWDAIFTSENPACTSTNTYEVWIDLTPPHRFRAFLPPLGPASPPPDPHTGGLPCPLRQGPPVEVGGAEGDPYPLRFVTPNTLLPAQQIYFQPDEDPWAWMRQMINEGRAHMEGTTEVYGRTVERVRIDPGPPASCKAPGHCPTEPEYAYFDPDTLYPVLWDWARDPTYPLVRNRWHYLVWEYLERTDGNLALTDIRAQHPDAIER